MKLERDELHFVRLNPDKTDRRYSDARSSYERIYNNMMAKGKGNLKPTSLAGNPIQLDTTNMRSLFKDRGSGGGKVGYNDYFVSTKADGLRFMMMIGKTDTGTIPIFFVDSQMNFWVLTDKQGRWNVRTSWEYLPLSFVYIVFNNTRISDLQPAFQEQQLVSKLTLVKQF